jgi:hypothetical protein
MHHTRKAVTAGVMAGLALVAVACGGTRPAPHDAPQGHTESERAAAVNWLNKTNQMWTHRDFAALGQVTTGQMRAIYQAEQQQATLPGNATRQPFQMSGLSVTVPCHDGPPAVFVAYADTDVFDLGTGMRPMAMVFERDGGAWKLATAVNRPPGGWPALCTLGAAPAAAPALAPGDYAAALARVLTHAETGAAETAATASPLAVNGFLSGPDSVSAQSATQIQKNRSGGVSFAGRFTPTANPTLALPLADGRGLWVLGILTQSGTYDSPSGVSAQTWPDGNQIATPRPAVVHHETDTFITTYAAIDPPRSAGARVVLDGFFGWPLAAVAS